jgi:hypothetical protein
MSEDNIKKKSFKLTVFETFPMDKLKRIIDRIETLGYKSYLCDNGNILFEEVEQ